MTTLEDTAVTVTVEVTSIDASAVALTIVTAPAHGTLTGAGPTWTYTPAHDYSGSDTVVVRAEDSIGSATATIAITVTAVDDAPIANADSFAGGFNMLLNIPLTAILDNDVDVDGPALHVTEVAAIEHGVPVLGLGNIQFTPEIGFEGVAAFEYTVSDGSLTSHATVSITIGVDEAPVAVDDAVTTPEDTTAVIADATLLANDSDPDLQTIRISDVGGASHGLVTHSGTQVTFVPDPDFHGAARFSYTITDGFKTDTATVVVTVTPVNDVPVAVSDTGETAEDTPLAFTSAALVANDSDRDGDDLTVVAVAATANTNGTVSLASGIVTYTPATDFNGGADFEYTVSDGHGGTAIAIVAVTVTPVNDAPVVVADTLSTDEDTALSTAATVLAGNDTDVDGDALTVTAVAATVTTHGTVSLSAGTVTYTPDPDYNGPADFAYTISDDSGGTASGSVQVTVISVNDAPVVAASAGTVSYTENDPAVAVDPDLVLADVDTPALVGATVQIVTGCTSAEDVLALASPPGGITATSYLAATCRLTLTGPASLATFQAALRLVTYANTSDTPSDAARVIAFTVDDGEAVNQVGSDTRDLRVTPVNDPPVPVADTLSTNEDTPVTVDAATLAANDTDLDGGALTVTAVAATGTTHGSVSLVTGTVTYTPDPDYNGPADFEYTVSDGNGGTAAGSVLVTVTSVNDAPVVVTSGGTVAYVENDPAVVVDPGVAITEVDTATLVGATVQLATGCASAEDVLAFASSPTGIAATGYLAATCTLTLSGTATVATYEAALRLVTYANTSDAPSGAARVVRFTIDDGEVVNHLGSGTRDLSVTPVNDPPVPVVDTLSTNEDTPVTVAAASLAANDTDVDGGPRVVTAVAATGTTHGSVSLVAGTVTYTPDPDHNGPADFAYTVSDGNGGTATGSVQVTVHPVNDAPVVVTSAGTVAYVENAPAVVIDPGVAIAEVDTPTLVGATVHLVTDCASPEDVLAFASPPGGIAATAYIAATCTLTLSGTASVATYEAALRLVTYANTSNAPTGVARVVRFTVDDGEAVNHLGSDTRDLSVAPVDDPPVAVNDTATVAEDAPATPITVLANDTDVDAGPRTISEVTQPANGTVAINIDATAVTYAPHANYCNQFGAGGSLPTVDTFTYTLSPGGSTATVSVTVICVDDAPVAVDDDETVAEDSSASSFFVLVNDTDLDGGPRAVASVTQPAHGSAAIGDGGGAVLYAPNPNYCNQAPNTPRDTFTYTLLPGGSSATVSVTVPCTCGKNKPTDFVVGST